MKVVCIRKFIGRVTPLGQRIPLGWVPEVDCVYTVIGSRHYGGYTFYTLAECPESNQMFESTGFIPLDFGGDVCEEIEKQFVEEMEEELV